MQTRLMNALKLFKIIEVLCLLVISINFDYVPTLMDPLHELSLSAHATMIHTARVPFMCWER